MPPDKWTKERLEAMVEPPDQMIQETRKRFCADLIEAARREENEACAKVADEWNARWCVGKETDPCPSEAIRARLTQRN
jgi:hypothetical protein